MPGGGLVMSRLGAGIERGIGLALGRTCRVFALAGALAATAVSLMVVVSIVGRAGFSAPVSGDVELTQFGIALAISLGLPWCQYQRANLIVDFFTARLAARTNAWLDAAGALLVALMCALLSWRSAAGALGVRDAHETSMILALPMWWAYASLSPGLALAAVVALWQAARHARGLAVPPAEGQPAVER